MLVQPSFASAAESAPCVCLKFSMAIHARLWAVAEYVIAV
jgi:hypothetical protein